MSHFFLRIQLLIFTILAGIALTACSLVHDDNLPRCEFRLHFVYDYNMKFADAFASQVDEVTLFICNEAGTFLHQQTIRQGEMKDGSVALDLEPGTYQMVTWAGYDNHSYTLPALTAGTSTIQDIKLRTLRAEGDTLATELHPLWHSYDRLVVTRSQPEEQTVSLTKDTNKVRIVLQNVMGTSLDADDFTFHIFADNGYLNYDNTLLDDTEIDYSPYYQESVSISADTAQVKQYVAVAELNTMRLMSGADYRLVVRRKGWEKDVLNINLPNYLLLTKMEGHNISAQEYLDRQDEYSIIFFLTPVGPDPNPTGYLCFKVQVKDWVIRLNPGQL